MNNFLDIIANDNHAFSAYLAQPKGKPKAGVVILQEIFGVNVHIQEVADLFAQNGYLAIAPSLFDRKERNVQLGYDKDGVAKGRELKDLCDNDALKDIEAAISVVSSAGKVGVIGYCWGGSLSWRAACEFNSISASVAYYGGEIPSLKDHTVNCNTLCHFGELDLGIPIETVKSFQQSQPNVLTYTYPADHGFNCNHRLQFNEISAKIALDRTLKFLETELN